MFGCDEAVARGLDFSESRRREDGAFAVFTIHAYGVGIRNLLFSFGLLCFEASFRFGHMYIIAANIILLTGYNVCLSFRCVALYFG